MVASLMKRVPAMVLCFNYMFMLANHNQIIFMYFINVKMKFWKLLPHGEALVSGYIVHLQY